jgi:predicted phosphodiesterase
MPTSAAFRLAAGNRLGAQPSLDAADRLGGPDYLFYGHTHHASRTTRSNAVANPGIAPSPAEDVPLVDLTNGELRTISAAIDKELDSERITAALRKEPCR